LQTGQLTDQKTAAVHSTLDKPSRSGYPSSGFFKTSKRIVNNMNQSHRQYHLQLITGAVGAGRCCVPCLSLLMVNWMMKHHGGGRRSG
jgi:hypothetical protein